MRQALKAAAVRGGRPDRPVRGVRGGRSGPARTGMRRGAALLAALLYLALSALLCPGTARAAGGVDEVAAALTKDPVYVDPAASGQLSAAQARTLARRIESADKPVFVAVLPDAARFPAATVLRDVRSAVGITGVYAIRLGDRFNAGADPQVMPHNAVVNLTGQVRRASSGDAYAELSGFVDQAVRQASGHAPDSWGDGSGSPGSSGAGRGAVVALVVIVLLAGGGFLLYRRARKARTDRERARLDELRRVVDEDITAFGEELDRLDFTPADPAADDAMRADYAHALDAYERAKLLIAGARGPQDVRPVTEALADGRFSLATLDARRRGEPLPERRPPCFFDPRHGPSVTDVVWAPPGGAPREVPACAADATRIADGDEPAVRTVTTVYGPQPYWNAGPLYAPWAGGYYGGGLLPGLLFGTMLGESLAAPGFGFGGYGYDAGYGGDSTRDLPAGGDYSGSDFDPGDFGGGFGGGGDSGGGDSGGGFDGGGFQ
jgi:hypothetical protein